MTRIATSLIGFFVIATGCSLPSFEEAETERRARAEAASTTAEPGSAPTTESEPDPTDPADSQTTSRTPEDLPTLAWASLNFEGNVIAEYEEPLSMVSRSGTNDLYVAQRNGVVQRIQRTFTSGGSERISTQTRVVLDISDQVSVNQERGLLDIEFSLDGRSLYVSYTDLAGDSVVDAYDIARSTRANPDSRLELIRVPQPFGNHNGGDIEIGADGFLYLGLGDGGGAGDPEGNGQDTTTLLGSILRIDPVATAENPYLIPDGNPFVDGGGAPEVFLYGVRNPWRFSFDPATGDLWVADVGQDEFEEVTLLRSREGSGRGANLGWNLTEGLVGFEGGTAPPNHAPPVYVYALDNGRCSIIGGQVYRGEVFPALQGVYVFGDYCTGELFGLEMTDDGPLVQPLRLELPEQELVSIDTDENGELHLVLTGGQILRLEPEVTQEG